MTILAAKKLTSSCIESPHGNHIYHGHEYWDWGPELVGDMIREIIESDTPTLRHPVGPDAEPFIAWRRSMTDEAWTELMSVDDDEEWASGIQRDFGLDVRPFLGQTPASIVIGDA